MSDLKILEAKLGHVFRDPGLLLLALTHPSVAHEKGVPMQHNQRLEYLGDAVLQLILTRELYEKFPAFGEGPLTKARAKLVNESALAQKGRDLDLGAHLVLSRGEESNGGRERASTLADAFEAVLGAIFLDAGFAVSEQLVLRLFADSFGELKTLPTLDNPKGELQEYLQSRSSEAPQYRVVSSTGPDHDRVFECTVIHGGRELARGSGKSKKLAESVAALGALNGLRKDLAARDLLAGTAGHPASACETAVEKPGQSPPTA